VGWRSPFTASAPRTTLSAIEPEAPPNELLELAGRQHGVVSRPQVRALGLPPHVTRHLLRPQDWVWETSQVARRLGAPVTEAQRLMTAVLDAGGDAAVSHLPGGRWWGLYGCSLRPVHVVRTGATRRRSDRAVVHRVRALPPHWVTTLDGVRICRPELVALQLFAVCTFDRAERLVDSLWSMRLLSGPSLIRFVDEMGASGRNGIAGVRKYLEPRGPNYVPPASGLESRAKTLFDDAAIPMRRQVDSGDHAYWTGRVDFRHDRLPLVVEVQSERYHTALADKEADARRIAALRAAGYVVVEVTDVELFAAPGVVLDRVWAAILEAEANVRARARAQR
jgi:very-short-patch-repair endonuclease